MLVKELADNIRVRSVLSSLLVRPKGQRFEIVFGAQHHRVAQIAGASTVSGKHPGDDRRAGFRSAAD